MVTSSAAMPVGGDELSMRIDVGDGARADVGSVAAGMVWPGPNGARSSMTTTADVAGGAHLDLWLEPTISVAGSDHLVVTRVDLAATASARIVEEVVLGRSGEPSGRLALSLRVTRDAQPLVHHHETFGPDVAGSTSSVSVGGARHVLSAVLVGIEPGRSRVSVDSGRAGAWLPVADDAVVIFAVGPDRPSVQSLLAAMAPELERRRPER